MITLHGDTRHVRFARPRSCEDYGFDGDGKAIEQKGSPSGFLLDWSCLDAVAKAKATGSPCEFVVVGEWVRHDGIRVPDVAVNPDFMEWQGYIRKHGRWVRRDD